MPTSAWKSVPRELDVSFVQGLKNDEDQNLTDADKDDAGTDDDDTGIGVKLTTDLRGY